MIQYYLGPTYCTQGCMSKIAHSLENFKISNKANVFLFYILSIYPRLCYRKMEKGNSLRRPSRLHGWDGTSLPASHLQPSPCNILCKESKKNKTFWKLRWWHRWFGATAFDKEGETEFFSMILAIVLWETGTRCYVLVILDLVLYVGPHLRRAGP